MIDKADSCIHPPSRLRVIARALSLELIDLVTLLLVWRERFGGRRRLRMLSDHMLKDIGISRADAECEAGKRFWRG